MSLLALIYRTAGAWGAGKGSNLTAAEFDENNYDIQLAVNDLINNPVQPHQLEDVTITDGNQLSFVLDDATVLGPVTIPVAAVRFRGEWEAETGYLTADMFTATDPTTGLAGLYFTNRPFESGLAFDPTLGIGIGGSSPYASFIMPIPNRVRVAWFWPTKPGEGLGILESSGDFTPMFSFIATDAFILPQDLTGSVANLRTAPVDFAATYAIRKNGVEVGDLTFAQNSRAPVFTFPDAVAMLPGDVLTMDPPQFVDQLAECLTLTLVGTLGELDSSSS